MDLAWAPQPQPNSRQIMLRNWSVNGPLLNVVNFIFLQGIGSYSSPL